MLRVEETNSRKERYKEKFDQEQSQGKTIFNKRIEKINSKKKGKLLEINFKKLLYINIYTKLIRRSRSFFFGCYYVSVFMTIRTG